MKLKKLISLVVLTTFVSGCTSYSSKPGKIEDLVGTYKLVTYKMRHEDQVKEGETPSDYDYDKQKEIGAVAYFSINKDGYSYYGYRDNSNNARVDQMFTTFTYDEEKTNLVKSIKMSDGITHKYDDQKAPGCLDEPVMGFKDELFKKTLNYTILSGHMLFQKERKIPYRFVEYKRVSKEASLAKVNEYMGTNVSFTKPYEMKAMSGYAVYRCLPKEGSDNKGIYEYAVLDLNSYMSGQLNLIYSLKENPGKQIKKVDISVEEKGKSMKIEGLGKTFYSSPNGDKLSNGYFNTRFEDYTEEDLYTGESFTLYYGADQTIEQIIEQEKVPSAPYLVRQIGDGEKHYVSLSYNEESEIYINGLHLFENEEVSIFRGYGNNLAFEDYVEEGTANEKVVEGSLNEQSTHNIKVTEDGSYDIRVDTSNKVHIVHS